MSGRGRGRPPTPPAAWGDVELVAGDRYVLGVDTGLATLGWALTDAHGAPIALGRHASKPTAGLRVAEDLAMRVDLQVAMLADLVDRVRAAGVDLVVGIEAMSWPRSSAAIAAIALCWGGLVGLLRARGVRGYHVPPAVWERSIAAGGHDAVADRLQVYLREQRPELAAWLLQLRADDRTHPIDGLGIAMAVAVAPELCTRIDAPVPDPARAHARELMRARKARARAAGTGTSVGGIVAGRAPCEASHPTPGVPPKGGRNGGATDPP